MNVVLLESATAETNVDLQSLIASAESFGGPGILVPSQNNALLRWCLSNGLRVVQPMTLMTVGFYNGARRRVVTIALVLNRPANSSQAARAGSPTGEIP